MNDQVPQTQGFSVTEQLVTAINSQNLGETCNRLLAEDPASFSDTELSLIRDGLNACSRVSTEVTEILGDVVQRLTLASIACEASPPVKSYPQLHQLVVQIASSDLLGALDVVADEGFVVDEVIRESADAIAACVGSLQLMAWRDYPIRLLLQWRQPNKTHPVFGKLAPAPADFAVIKFSRQFYWGYFAIKPLRKLIEKIWGQRTEDKLGLRAGSFSLSTPRDLIIPLMNVANLGKHDVLFDVGCGDGRILTTAAEAFGCKAIGVERNTALVEIAETEIQRKGLSENASVLSGDVKKADLTTATVVFLFLPSHVLPDILRLVKSVCRPGTLVIAHEQSRIDTGIEPVQRVPVFAGNAITVAHVWKC